MTPRARVALSISAILIGGFIGFLILRTPADGRSRIQIDAPGITLTAPGGTSSKDRLIFDFAPWLELGVEGEPISSHLSSSTPTALAEQWLPQLLPGASVTSEHGQVSGQCGRDRLYLLVLQPLTVKDEGGATREVLLVVARGVSTPSRACLVVLDADGGGIERRGTELRPATWFEKVLGAPQHYFRLEFAKTGSTG